MTQASTLLGLNGIYTLYGLYKYYTYYVLSVWDYLGEHFGLYT